MSLTELLIIFAVILIVFGPDRLPELAHKIGKMSAELRKVRDGVRREFYNAAYPPAEERPFRLSEIERELRAIKNDVLAVPPPAQQQTEGRSSQPPTDTSSRAEGERSDGEKPITTEGTRS